MAKQKDRNWTKLVPYATWIANSQVHTATGFSPAELFFGRPAWLPDMVPDPEDSPKTREWIEHQIELQNLAAKRLQHLREMQLRRANRGRTEVHYSEGEYVLIHKRRFPQWPTSILGSQWFGPFRVQSVKSHAVVVRASPKLGGEVEVAYSFLKKFPQGIGDDEDEGGESNDEKIAEEDERLSPDLDLQSEKSAENQLKIRRACTRSKQS